MLSHTKFQNVDIAVKKCVHVLAATTDGTKTKGFCLSVQKHCRQKESEEKEGNCKAFLRYR